MATLNPMAAVRQVKRMTVGEILKAKQDRAENLANIAYISALRPQSLREIGAQDFRILSARYTIPPVSFHVLTEKESGADTGFTKLGRLLIANEPQYFSRRTAGAYDLTHPNLCYPKWARYVRNAKPPAQFAKHPLDMSQVERWLLWTGQAQLDFNAACCALSVGRFQVMVDHWKKMGFSSPAAMIEFAYVSEANQLELAVKWFLMNDMMDALRKQDWWRVALYNGTGNRQAYADDCKRLAARLAPIYA